VLPAGCALKLVQNQRKVDPTDEFSPDSRPRIEWAGGRLATPWCPIQIARPQSELKGYIPIFSSARGAASAHKGTLNR
jgi:hypothetical protein